TAGTTRAGTTAPAEPFGGATRRAKPRAMQPGYEAPGVGRALRGEIGGEQAGPTLIPRSTCGTQTRPSARLVCYGARAELAARRLRRCSALSTAPVDAMAAQQAAGASGGSGHSAGSLPGSDGPDKTSPRSCGNSGWPGAQSHWSPLTVPGSLRPAAGLPDL